MKRSAWTVVESVVAIAWLGLAATMVGQLAAWSIQERIRNEVRLAAIEWAANVLETANATKWADLNSEWAAKQTFAADLAERMLNPTASVLVSLESDRVDIKRVTVNVKWFDSEGAKAPPVELMTYFSAPEAK